MVNHNDAPLIRSPYGQPPPGSTMGDIYKSQFRATLEAIVAGGSTTSDLIRFFWMPTTADATTNTTLDRDARTLTYDATVAAEVTPLGSGVQWALDGSASQGDVPDSADLSALSGGVDAAFSIIVLANITNNADIRTLLAKWDGGEAIQEYALFVDGSDILTVRLRDDSANVNTVRASDAAISMGAWHLFSMDYDGSGGATAGNGVTLREDAAVIASTATNNASYVDMEDGTSVLSIGAISTASTPTWFFAGSMALAMVVIGKQVTDDQHWAIKNAVNAYFGLSL